MIDPETATLGLGDCAVAGGPTSGPVFLPHEIAAGRFRVIRLLGQGGMAQVFEAEDLELGQRVAIKVIRPELAASRRARDLLKQEVLLARRVTHPNVCRIFDVFQHVASPPEGGDGAGEGGTAAGPQSGTLVLVMELLQGETLSRCLERAGRLTAAEALPIVRQLAEALDAAHRSQVVHGDFKSSNIILEPAPSGPRAVVTDFGLARHAAAGAAVSGGTTAYMAPEQLLRGEVTRASDLFALGVVIHEVVTGSRPLPTPAGLAGLSALPGSEPPSARRLEELPPAWRQTLARCLAAAPEDRPASAAEVVRSLASGPLRPRPRRRPVPGWARTSAALAACGLLLILLQPAGVAPRPVAAPAPALGAAAGAGAAGRAPRRSGRTAGGAARLAIAVGGLTDATPHGGGAAAPWLPAALTHMILSEIGPVGPIEAFPLGATPAPADADLETSGSFQLAATPAGDPALRIRLEVRRVATGRRLATIEEGGRLADASALVARLGSRLRRSIGLPEPSPADRIAALAQRPASLEAEGYFAQGLAHLAAGDPVAAAAALDRALAADPRFPLSLAASARACMERGDFRHARAAAQQAAQRSHALPEMQRMEIAAIDRMAGNDPLGAEGLFQTLWRLAPHGTAYGLQLVEAQLSTGQLHEALANLQTLRAAAPDDGMAALLSCLEAQAQNGLADSRAALAAARTSERLAQQTGNAFRLATAEIEEADALAASGDVEAANRVVGLARGIFQRLGVRSGEGEVLYRLAVLAHRAGKPQQAMALYRQALAIFIATDATASSAAVLRGMGRTAHSLLDVRLAGQYFERSRATYHRLGDRRGEADSTNNLALVVSDRGHHEEAERLLHDVISIDSQIGNRQGLASALSNLSFLEQLRGELQGALDHTQESLRISQEIGVNQGVAIGYVDMAALQVMKGDVQAALAGFIVARKLGRQGSWRGIEADALNGEAWAMQQQGRLVEANQLLLESLALTSNGSDPGNASTTLTNLGRVALWQARYADAERWARELVRQTSESHAGDPIQPQALLAASLVGQGRLAEAQAAITRATRRPAVDHGPEADLHLALAAAQLALAEKRQDEAARLLREALGRYATSPYPDVILESRLTLAYADLALGRTATVCPDLRALEAQTTQGGFTFLAREAHRLLARTPACGASRVGHG
jgi:tetratricopeptide (TPR) repeat protein